MKEKLLELFRAHPFALIGLGLGLLTAILFLTVGFWGTLLIALLCGTGLWLGSLKDKGRSIVDTLINLWYRIRALLDRF